MHAKYRPVTDIDAGVTITRVQLVTGQGVIFTAKCDYLSEGSSGNIKDDHGVRFLTHCIASVSIWRNSNVLRLQILTGGVAGENPNALCTKSILSAIQAIECDGRGGAGHQVDNCYRSIRIDSATRLTFVSRKCVVP